MEIAAAESLQTPDTDRDRGEEDPRDSFEDEVEYFRWASVQLTHLLDQEDGRQKSLERKSTVAVAFALGLGAYSVRTVTGSTNALAVTLILVGGGVALAAMWYTYQAVKVKRVKTVRASQFVAGDVNALEVRERYQSVSWHLRKTLEGYRKEVEETGRYADRAQTTAFIAALLFFLATAMDILI